MIEVPGETPLTMKPPEEIVATDVLLLLHPPPVVASLKVVDVPVQKFVTPAIAAGALMTDIDKVTVHPAPSA
jgi:hypothetical protein